MGVRCVDFKYVYLCEQRKKGWAQGKVKLQRKIGATSRDDPRQRTNFLNSQGNLHYDVVKIWRRPNDAAAVEWVAKHLLKEIGEDGFEHVNACTQTCLDAVEQAIKIVERRDFGRWPRSRWPRCLRMFG